MADGVGTADMGGGVRGAAVGTAVRPVARWGGGAGESIWGGAVGRGEASTRLSAVWGMVVAVGVDTGKGRGAPDAGGAKVTARGGPGGVGAVAGGAVSHAARIAPLAIPTAMRRKCRRCDCVRSRPPNSPVEARSLPCVAPCVPSRPVCKVVCPLWPTVHV